jgi:hypothetical protein
MSNRVEAEASAASPLSVGQWRWLMALVAVAGIVWILVSRVPPDARAAGWGDGGADDWFSSAGFCADNAGG